MTCYLTGKRCLGNHKLRAGFWGDGMISYEEFRPWVATPKTPAQPRESSAIGAYGTSKVAPEQLERGIAQSLNEFYQEIAQMTWGIFVRLLGLQSVNVFLTGPRAGRHALSKSSFD